MNNSCFVFIWANKMRESHTTACEGQVQVLKNDLQSSNKLFGIKIDGCAWDLHSSTFFKKIER